MSDHLKAIYTKKRNVTLMISKLRMTLQPEAFYKMETE